MAMSADRLRRKQRLVRLIADLKAELAELEEETEDAGFARVLSENFFWSHLAPILRGAPEVGMPNRQLHEELLKRGRKVPNAAFRVFLNRMKRRGWVEHVPHSRGHGGWRLSKNAKEQIVSE
jgi:hypothetical protein